MRRTLFTLLASTATISQTLAYPFLHKTHLLAFSHRAIVPPPFLSLFRRFSHSTSFLTAMTSEQQNHTPRILSIQSHTVHGFVGNKAVTFPLQTMGFDVNAINTITLSNHPAYSKGTKGQSLDPDVLKQILTGLEDNSLLNYDVVMTGYTRFPAHLEHIADVVRQIRIANPQALYICDPVLGDNDQYYVPAELTAKYRELLLPLASVITPNIFECQVLSDITIKTQSDAIAAAKKLHSFGPSIVVMTGLPISNQGAAGELSILLSYLPRPHTSSEPVIFRMDVPRLEGYYAGCGDLFSAFTTSAIAHLSQHYPNNPYTLGTALEYAAEAMSEVLELTKARGSRELSIIAARDVFISLQKKLQRLLLAPPLSSSSPSDIVQDLEKLRQSQPRNRAILVNHPKALGVIFDMDGTLTEPHAIDFQAMYDRIGLTRTKDTDILTLVNALPSEEEKARAMEIIYDEEMKGIERQVLRKNMRHVIEQLYEAKLRLAVCTRNCEQAYVKFLSQSEIHSHYFIPALFRESTGPQLQKPNPALARHILASWKPSEVETEEGHGLYWFVGDSIDDMKCGKLAGLTTVLILTDYNQDLQKTHPDLVDHVIHSLDELLPLLGLTSP